MFADYILLVVQDYHQKQAANALSPLIVHPTPAKLKQECLAVCNERFLRKDERVLRAFFGQSGDAKSFLQAIQRCETDRFKPLVNFLKKQTINTEEKNIELLAWLIDFEPRPFEFGKRYDLNGVDVSVNTKEELQGNDDKTGGILTKETSYSEEINKDQQVISGKQTNKLKTKSAIAAVIILLSMGIVIYWPWSNKTSTTVLTGHERCMYWTGNHYQVISCSQKLGDTLVLGLDSVKLIHFKRITIPDTITRQSIGKVWYIKRDGNLEFYTAEGYHPIDTKRRLWPITDYIIKRHIRPARKLE